MFNWNKLDIRAIAVAGNFLSSILSKALSWTFGALGYNTDENASEDNVAVTPENALLLQEYCFESSGAGEQVYYNGAFPQIGTGDMTMEFYAKVPVAYGDYDLSIGTSYFGSNTRVNMGIITNVLYAVFQVDGTVYAPGVAVATLGINDNTWHKYKYNADRDGNLTLEIDDIVIPAYTTAIAAKNGINPGAWPNKFRIGAYGSVVDGVQGAGNTSFYDVKVTVGGTTYEWPFQGSEYDVSGNALHLTKTNGNRLSPQNLYQYNATNGFDHYLDNATSTDNILVPYVSGTPVVASIAGYTLQGSYPAGTIFTENARWVESYCKFFDGATNFINIGNDSSLDLGTGDHTVLCRIKETSPAAYRGIANRRSGTNVSFCYYLNTGTPGSFDGSTLPVATTTLTVNVWYTVAFRFTKSTNTVEFFVNGAAAGTGSQAGYKSMPTQDTVIGAVAGVSGPWMKGDCCDVQFYNKKLTNQEIIDHAASGAVAHYPLQNSYYDVSGNGLHGTAFGTFVNNVQDNYHYNIVKGFSFGASLFNGTDSIVNFGDLGAAPSTGTIEFTFMADSVAGLDNILHTNFNEVTGNVGIRFELNAGNLNILIGNDAGTFTQYTVAAVSANTFYKVTTTWDWVALTLDVSLNDVPQISVAYPLNRQNSNFSNFVVGTGWTGRYFAGGIANVTFNSVLDCTLRGTVLDTSGNNNHGTPTNIEYTYTPALSDGSTLADTTLTSTIENPANISWHNGCETKFIIGATTYDTTDDAWNMAGTVLLADTDNILTSSSTGYGIAQAYSDMKPEQGNYLFMDTSTANQYKNVLLFPTTIGGQEAIALHQYLGNGGNLLTDASGAYIFDASGFPIWV